MSYKSDSTPRYNAKDLAKYIAEKNNCPLVLGSATPEINTMYLAKNKEIFMYTLSKRANNAKLPEVEVVDLRNELALGNRSMISFKLQNEIERKFVVKKLPDLTNITPLDLTQTYLKAPEGEERRVRSINNKTFVMTIKRPISSDGLTREEVEKEISKEDYELFLTQKIGNTIHKTRYKIPAGNGLVYELDIYHDKLKGLEIVEVEFSSEKEAKEFENPDWFGKEVTSDKRYKNASLAKKGIPKEAFEH